MSNFLRTLPIEKASKIAHMQMIQDQSLTAMLQSFKADDDSSHALNYSKSGQIKLGSQTKLKQILTIDGGLAVVPNPLSRKKAMGFIQVGSCLLKMADLDRLKEDPMMDPREIKELLKNVHFRPALIPLAGVRIPSLSVRDTIRHGINGIFEKAYSNLYPILEYLIFRQWQPSTNSKVEPSMDCFDCGSSFHVPSGSRIFCCPDCGFDHFLSDYMQIGKDGAEEWSTQETASAIMAVMETLALFEIPVHLAREGKLENLQETLFIKDGPLLMRAALSRLVEPIREFIQWIHDQSFQLHIVGIEKNGDFFAYLDEFSRELKNSGDYFLPSVPFLLEEISGACFDEATYRNRVSFGTKIAVRLDQNHIVSLNIPTGEGYPLYPKFDDLIGFERVIETLAALTSSSYENALIPLVLAKKSVSISQAPSGNILHSFAEMCLKV